MNSLMLWGVLWDSCVAGSGPFFRRTLSDSCGTPVAAMTQLAIYKTNSPCSGKDEKQSLQHNVVWHLVTWDSSRVTLVSSLSRIVLKVLGRKLEGACNLCCGVA